MLFMNVLENVKLCTGNITIRDVDEKAKSNKIIKYRELYKKLVDMCGNGGLTYFWLHYLGSGILRAINI